MSHCIQLYVHLNTFGPNFFNQSCSSHFKLQSLCQPKFEYSSNFWRKITAEGHGTEQHLAFSFRPFVGSADSPQHCCATWTTNTSESFSSRARLPGASPRTGYPSTSSPSRCRPASNTRE